MIRYQLGNALDLDRVIELYHASTLGERRPVSDRAAMADMLAHANLVVTAWDGDQLVGIARTLTDFSYVAYLADLAVSLAYQQQGIGRRLIAETAAQLGPHAKIVLLAAPGAVAYYPHIGFKQHPSAWLLEKPQGPSTQATLEG